MNAQTDEPSPIYATRGKLKDAEKDGQRAYGYAPGTEETLRLADDLWNYLDDEIMTDSKGNPMVLRTAPVDSH